MQYLLSFLTNNIVIAWIAPIITAIIATGLIKIISVRRKSKEFADKVKAGNSKIIDTIRPYIIQKVRLDLKIIHGIRRAVARNVNLPEKYLCSDYELMCDLIYDISTTRFVTEEDKRKLMDDIVKVFEGTESNERQEVTKKKEDINIPFLAIQIISMFILLILSLLAYRTDPSKAEDLNSTLFTIIFLLLMMAFFLGVGIYWQILKKFISFSEGEIIIKSGSSAINGVITQYSKTVEEVLKTFEHKIKRKKDNIEDENKKNNDDIV